MNRISRLDVERFRTVEQPTVILRAITSPWLILGSSQEESILGVTAGVQVARRRGGGGAVLIDPERDLWIDVWIPVEHHLHHDDVRAQLEVIGAGFSEVLRASSGRNLDLAEPRPSVDADEQACCFLSRGAGEVLVDGAKLVGLAAWRSRQGALVQGALARHRSTALAGYLDSELLSSGVTDRLLSDVADLAALGLAEIPGVDLAHELAKHFGAASLSLHPELTE